MIPLSRRTVTLGLAVLPVLGACGEARTREWSARMKQLERQRGDRIGVVVHDTWRGAVYTHRADRRFALCSTFKWMLGAAVLSRVDAGLETLSRSVKIEQSDLVPYAPTTGPAVGGSLTVGELCAATIRNSDNPAANLLLDTLGGPEGFTRIMRSFGDTVTRLDRYEPELNLYTPGDPRDTTTPRAMAQMMERLLFGDSLSASSKTTLQNWMLGTVTGAGRLTAGLPEGWRLGHKTGTNTDTMSHDVGFALPPDGPDGPVILVSFTDGPDPMSAEADQVHAEIARAAFNALGV